MKHHTTTATQLDQVRGRRIVVAVVVMLSFGMLIGSPAAASIIDAEPECSGFSAGLPDGCWEPQQDTDPGPPCTGFTAGLPDGCWEPPEDIEGAGKTSVLPFKITRIPSNVI